MMDSQALLNGAFALVIFLGGFVLRSVWGALTQLQHDMALLQKALAETYVRRDDFSIWAARLEAALIRIENRIEGKVDK